MACLPLVIMWILIVIIFALSAKIYFLHRGAKEIAEAFRDRLETDINTLIDLSTRDPYMRRLATEINAQLRLLNKERRRFQQGDQELKTAVTNISHDLRTPLTAIRGYLDLLEREEAGESVRRYLAQISNRTEATGLGLSIAKALTEQMDGSIEAEYKHDTVFITVNFLQRRS